MSGLVALFSSTWLILTSTENSLLAADEEFRDSVVLEFSLLGVRFHRACLHSEWYAGAIALAKKNQSKTFLMFSRNQIFVFAATQQAITCASSSYEQSFAKALLGFYHSSYPLQYP